MKAKSFYMKLFGFTYTLIGGIMIPDLSPKLFSLSAVAVGYLLIDDLTANEQNALGNWLMLTAQVLCTNAYYKQLEQERGQEGKKDTKISDEVEVLKKMVNALNVEIANLKSK